MKDLTRPPTGSALLAERTKAAARLRPRDIAFRVYLVILLGPAAAILLESVVGMGAALLDVPLPLPGAEEARQARALTAVGLALAACYAVHTGAWHGPFALDRADASWLLGSPLARRPLLLPRVQRAALLGAGAGAGLAGVVAVVLAQVLGGAMLPAAAVAAAGGAGLGVAVVASAWWALSAGDRAQLLLRAVPVVASAVVAGGSVALLRPSLAGLVLWSGPWGWIIEAAASAGGGALPSAAAWSAPSVLFGAVGLRWLVASAGAAPAEQLLLRSQHAAAVAAAVFLQEADAFNEARRDALDGLRAPSGVRLPLPRSPRWAVAWLDTTVLLRAPGRTLLACGEAAAGGALIALGLSLWPAADAATSETAVVRGSGTLAAGVLLAQVAAGAWNAPLRAALARPFGHAHLPWSHGALVRRHVAMPLLALGVTVGIGACTAVLLGAQVRGLAAALLPVPLLGLTATLRALRSPRPPGENAQLSGNDYAAFVYLARGWRHLLAFLSALVLAALLAAGAPGLMAVAVAVTATATAWVALQRKAAPWED